MADGCGILPPPHQPLTPLKIVSFPIPVLGLLLPTACGSGVWDPAPIIVPTNMPHVPSRAVLDYDPHPGMAHAALPPFDPATGRVRDGGRVWLKGSATAPRARIASRAGG